MDKNIEFDIKIRNYNGNIQFGSIINREIKFKLYENNAITTCNLEFLINENTKENAIASFSYPFIISDNRKEELIIILNQIKIKKNYEYNKSHYNKEKFDIKFLDYIDIIIDNKNYEAKINDELVMKIRDIINFKFPNNAVYSSYNYILEINKNI